MKIGVTEAGDPSFDFSWVGKMDDVEMAVLITKNLTDELIEKIMLYSHKIVLHATCTGYGGTVLEKQVPPYNWQLDQVKKLISKGFPSEQIVIRIDPVIPTHKGFGNLLKVVSYIHKDVKRFRISILDNYPNVQERFRKNGLPVLYNGNFQASNEDFDNANSVLRQLKTHYGVVFESCAETLLTEAERIGCVSEKDLALFGLKPDTDALRGQRRTCLCVAGKTELLAHQHYGLCKKFGISDSLGGSCGVGNNCNSCEHHERYGCPNACLYCYWK